MTIFRDTVFLDIVGWTVGDGLIATNNDIQITGSLDMTGTITAREFHTELVSSSIVYLSGSTLFGDTLDDVHENTGSWLVTGSLNVNNGGLYISGALVGIGTEDPKELLHVFGIISASNIITDNGGTFWTGSGAIITRESDVNISGSLNLTGSISIDGGILFISGTTAEEDLFKIQNSSGSEMLFISSSGNIGIGTVTPSEKLQVFGRVDIKIDNAIDGTTGMTVEDVGGGNNQSQIIMRRNSADVGFIGSDNTTMTVGALNNQDVRMINTDLDGIYVKDVTGDVGIGISTPSAKLHISGSEAEDDLFRIQNSSGSEMLFVSASGNVGIGITTPERTLHLAGSFLMDNNQVFSFKNAAGTINPVITVTSGDDIVFGETSAGGFDDIIFQTADVNTALIIKQTGDVGIGTATPASLFTVHGEISASSAKLTGDLNISASAVQNAIFATTGSFQLLEKAAGTFKIQHPDPSKSDKNLYHSFVESPTAGDNLYRFEIQAFSDNEQVTTDLPDYFSFLNEKPQIFVQALGQFAQSYASVDQQLKKLRVVCEKKGFYDVLLIATRKDKDALQAWTGGVERNK